MSEKHREYSTVQVVVPPTLAAQIYQYGKYYLPDEVICQETGREENIHLTVLYGITTAEPERVMDVVGNTQSFEVSLGHVSLFRNEGFDVVKIDAWSDGAARLNRLLRNSFPYKNTFSVYRPHVTVAYVRKGRGETCDREEIFRGSNFMVRSVDFRSTNGSNTSIPLLG